jgi:AraC family transcriptional regulator, transcriptional activator of pobA
MKPAAFTGTPASTPANVTSGASTAKSFVIVPATAKPAATLIMVPFREVRHSQPEDSLYVESINVRGQEYEWTIPAHRHEGLHQFQLLTHGSARATLDGAAVEITAPAALMVAPGVVHGFVYERSSAGQQVTVPTASLRSWLGAAPALDAQLRQSIHVGQGVLGSDLDECEGLFASLAREFAQSRPGRAEALNAHALVLALWFLRHAATAPAGLRQQALKDALVQRYRALLELHFRQQRPLAFYAEALAITADHLSRTCRATTGESALALMHDRVTLEARRLLAHTPGTVIDIAQALGFDDPGHFSRFFSKRVGQAPSSYCNAIANGLVRAPGQGATSAQAIALA